MNSKLSPLLLSVLFGALFVSSLSAQVPHMLNYQGRIATYNGSSYVGSNGPKQFKFALVNATGTTTYWSNDGTSSSGSQPAAAVSTQVDSGIFSVILGDTSLPNMQAVSPAIFQTHSNVWLRVWFNDPSTTIGWEQMSPDTRIVSVGYAMMAASVEDGAVTSAKIGNGAVGSTQLAAGAVNTSLLSASLSAVGANGIIGSEDPNNAALLAQGFVRDPGLITADDSWTTLPTGDAVAGHTAIWADWGALPNQKALLIWGGAVPSSSGATTAINRGIKYDPSTGVWTPISMTGAPQPRYDHSAVWTGSKMIIFGGQTGFEGLNNGGIYDPSTDKWEPLPPAMNGPTAVRRTNHLAFWTGTQMLIWGGYENPPGPLGLSSVSAMSSQGWVFSSGSWSAMSAPSTDLDNRSYWAGVWTGQRLVVWNSSQTGLSSGGPIAGSYEPGINAWTVLPAISSANMEGGGSSIVWDSANNHVVIWGGLHMGTAIGTGIRLDMTNPASPSWITGPSMATFSPRTGHMAAMVGNKMVVWGGNNGNPTTPVYYNDGGYYDSSSGQNSWTPILSTGAPTSRRSATVTPVRIPSSSSATTDLLIWGGFDPASSGAGNLKFLKNVGRWNPSGGWTQPAYGSPAPRAGHTMIWTGTEAIIWGGTATIMPGGGGSYDPTFNDGVRYNPSTGVWTPLPSLNAPTGRYGHSAVWTGSKMIIWGGQRFGPSGQPTTLNDGAIFDGTAWSPVNLTGAPPSARSFHSAVWTTGTTPEKMIIWGGTTDGSGMNTNTGASYDPAGTWSSISLAPFSGANRHLAFWTGSEMILIGAGGGPSINSRYNPVTNVWSLNAGSPDFFPASNITNSVAAQWSGTDVLAAYPNSGAFLLRGYSPISNFWQSLAVPSNLTHQAPLSVWTGNEMIVWTTATSFAPFGSSSGSQAARYSPATGLWTPISNVGAPTQASGTAVWTGSKMIIWGGRLGNGPDITLNDIGSCYRPPQNYYFYRRP